ncbi:hypothetical protein TNCV_508661 [Trichonephila clavipes]|nr:hypothetical protein TNCV_508661 [Trichonephila clavipes]
MPQKFMLDDTFSEPTQWLARSNCSSFQQMSEANCVQWVYAVVHSLISCGVSIYRPFGEFRRANSYCHLYGAQGERPTTGVLLAPCHDEFRGPRSDYVRQGT